MNQTKFTYDEFIEEMEDVAMDIGDIADRLEITIEEAASCKSYDVCSELDVLMSNNHSSPLILTIKSAVPAYSY